jgi:hypothetical protein
MTESQKLTLEEKCLVVDSEHFKDVTWAVDRKGKGMHIITPYGSIPLDKEDISKFFDEGKAVWEHMRARTV